MTTLRAYARTSDVVLQLAHIQRYERIRGTGPALRATACHMVMNYRQIKVHKVQEGLRRRYFRLIIPLLTGAFQFAQAIFDNAFFTRVQM
jgi:hypothetical protein